MRYTKGQWFNNGGRIYAQQGDDIREICDVGLVNHQSKEDTANARLITAAPMGYELAQAILDQEQDGFDRSDFINKKAAEFITKVE